MIVRQEALACVGCLWWLIGAAAAGPAGIKLDGTLGPSAAALVGPNYSITQNMGKLSGGNLFFSFQYFNVATNEIATFYTTSTGINNVISRVTGGFASTIDGEISLVAAYGAPNFFFINPSGVTFTANANVNVPAAFYVTTANYLKFSDGSFYADPTKVSTLSAAAPEAFGFLGKTRAPVDVEGSFLYGGSQGGSLFAIVAGCITVDSATQYPDIFNLNGGIELTAVGYSAGEVPLSGSFPAATGLIKITDGASILTESVGNSNAGSITLNAGSVVVDGSGYGAAVQSFTEGQGNAGSISIAASGTVAVVDGGLISSTSVPVPAGYVPPTSYGNAGNVSITAKDVIVEGQGFSGFGAGSSMGILSETETSGNAGKVEITAGTVTVAKGAGITPVYISAQADLGSGSAGEVDINASGTISVFDGGVITAATGGSGNAGSVHLTAPDLMIQGQDAVGNTLITADSLAGASGNGGSIEINVGSLTVDGNGGTSAAAGITSIARAAAPGSPASTGAGGTITINASGPVSIIDGGVIETDTSSAKPAGDIDLVAASLSIRGEGYSSTLHGTDISSNSGGAGAAGNVTIKVGTLSIAEGDATGFAGVQAVADSTGSGGQVVLSVSGTASITDGGSIRSNTYAAGNAGDVTVTAGTLDINATGFTSRETAIEADTFGSGKGGAVNVTAQTLSIIGVPADVVVGIESQAENKSTGSAGAVTVDVTGNASISNHGEVASDSDSTATGNAGRVNVHVGGTLTLDTDGVITSSTASSGNAGDVSVFAHALNIQGSANTYSTAIAAVSDANGNAGSVTVTVGSLLVDGGGGLAGISSEVLPSESGATTPKGGGGEVTVTVSGNATLQNGGGILATSYGSGTAGDITVSAGNLAVGGGAQFSEIASQAIVSGRPGRISIAASNVSIDSNGYVDIGNFSTVPHPGMISPTQISISARTIDLDGGDVTAASSGNVAASGISIDYSRGMTMNSSTIVTTSNDGNGGPITVNGHGPLFVDASSIQTSVSGTNGNGGDIDISVPLIVMNTAAFQANTAARHASGGDIKIDAGAIVPSFQSFILDKTQQTFDPTRDGLNLVQAVAPNGIPGTLQGTVPTLDLGNALLALTGRPHAPVALNRARCNFTAGSSLAVSGRGGVAPTAYDPLAVDPASAWRQASTSSVAPILYAGSPDHFEPDHLEWAQSPGCPEWN